MIKLKNVSKFYYGKGVVSSGFTKINLELEMGQFVVITGESGSGKSTLLNVISGVDSYEDGEMYIDGKETSHYVEEDYENYRRKYIGNIFQNFNLVNSYTVYQNIELSVILNGESGPIVRDKVNKLISTVGLTKWKNTKVSKLSGGQKQRVAIARALAKDTPIIIADEPTGNLDSKSAVGIMKLLKDISKEKLVVIVTHNYEQVSDYATRKIRMSDGRILEDKIIEKTEKPQEIKLTNYKSISLLNKIKLGVRNTFNIVPKFIIILLVFLFMTFILLSNYANFKKAEYENERNAYSYIFRDGDPTRIIVTKDGKLPITNEDLNTIKSMKYYESMVENDVLLDDTFSITDFEENWINGSILPIEKFDGELIYGRMPENDNEVIISVFKMDYYYYNRENLLYDKEGYPELLGYKEGNTYGKLKIVGVSAYSDGKSFYRPMIYGPQKLINAYRSASNQKASQIDVHFQDKIFETKYYDMQMALTANVNVPAGQAYIPDSYSYLCKDSYCINRPLKAIVKNPYYTDELNFTVTKTYKKENIKNLLGITNIEDIDGKVFINPSDFNRMFEKDLFQISVFADEVDNVIKLKNSLEKSGFKALSLKEATLNDETSPVFKILKVVGTAFVIIFLFYTSYFVIKITLKSRNIYYSTLRVLGATKWVSNQLLMIELTTSTILSFLILTIATKLSSLLPSELFLVSTFTKMDQFLQIQDYLFLFVILILMSLLISQKFAKSLFKKSALQTLKEEV